MKICHNGRVVRCILGIVVFLSVLFFCKNDDVFAYIYVGTGSGSGGSALSCGSAAAFQLLCGSPVGSAGGGASWRLYSTAAYSGPTIDSSLVNQGVQSSYPNLDTIKSACPSNQYDYYVAFGWEGIGRLYGRHLGPMANGQGTVAYAYYNNYNEYGGSIKELKEMIRNGAYRDGMKLSVEVANALYKDETGGTVEPEPWVGYYCVGELNSNEYFSLSNVSANSGANSVWGGTGIHEEGDPYTKNTSITIGVGEAVNIAFSHLIYSSASETTVRWDVSRSYPFNASTFANSVKYTDSNNGIEITDSSFAGTTGRTTDITDSYSNSQAPDVKFIAKDLWYSGGGSNYLMRDEFTATFSKEGSYDFCEDIKVKNGNFITKACVKVNVVKAPEYYTSSHVSNRESETSPGENDYQRTAITTAGKPDSTATAQINLNVGGTAYITFSHNVYADKKSDDAVNWRVSRAINGDSSNGFSGSGYTITTPSGPPYSSNTINGPTNGVAYITQERSSGGTPKYIAQGVGSGTSRPYTDSGESAGWYVLRDYYKITFSVAGEYEFCETISIGGVGITTACSKVVVGGETNECSAWVPSSYTNSSATSGETSVVSKVQNATLRTGWGDSVYAKPTDNVKWIHCYYPGVQAVANTSATGYGSISPGVGNHALHDSNLELGGTTENSYSTVSSLYGGSWGNSFSVTSTNLRNPTPRRSPLTGKYANGDTTMRMLLDSSYTVQYGSSNNKAGLTLTESSESSTPTTASVTSDGKHSWDCNYGADCEACGGCATYSDPDPETGEKTCLECKSCYRSTCQHSNDYIKANWGKISAKDSASALVPYNFINTISVSLSGSHVYAGESARISTMNAQVRTRYNGTLRGTYATNVDDAKVQLVAYLSTSNAGSERRGVGSGKNYNACNALSGYEECGELSSMDGLTLNASGALKLGSTEGTLAATDSVLNKVGSTFNVFDARAGKYYCVVAAVYPYTSGYDTNIYPSGSNTWYVSAPSCVKIAKKPSLQVWGNSLYTAGVIGDYGGKGVVASTKNVVNGVYGWSSTSRENTTVFGSWVEYGIVANGLVDGIASGASTGNYNAEFAETRTPVNGLGGSKEGRRVSLCIRSPLTMPNSGCNSQSGFKPGGTTGAMNAPNDKDKLVARFMNENITNAGVEYEEGVTSINEVSVNKAKTIVKVGDGDITINGNIIYDSNNLLSLTEIPKMIIYAKGNINIKCNVTQIDAVLIANGNVNTCSDGGDINSSIRSTQLKINGAVITNTMTAGRTYGSATGYNSTIPAEIINYDTSLYLWGAPRSDASSSGKLDTVYLKEVAPRY